MNNKSIFKALIFGMLLLLAGAASAGEWDDRYRDWENYAIKTALHGKNPLHGDMEEVAQLAHSGDERAIFAYYLSATHHEFKDKWSERHRSDAVAVLRDFVQSSKGKNPILDASWVDFLFKSDVDSQGVINVSCDKVKSGIDILRDPVGKGYARAMYLLADIHELYSAGCKDITLSSRLRDMGSLYSAAKASGDDRLAQQVRGYAFDIAWAPIKPIFPYLSMGFVVVFFVGGVWWLKRRARRLAAERLARDRKFVADFITDGGASSFEVKRWFWRGVHIAVDRESRIVTINRKTRLTPLEFVFSNRERQKTVYYNTGGPQTVYTSNGASGTVYVPGESGSYDKTVGYSVTIARREGTRPENVANQFWDNEAIDKEKFERLAQVRFSTSQEEDYNLMVAVLEKVRQWCIDVTLNQVKSAATAKKNAAEQAAQAELALLCTQAAVGQERFTFARWNQDGSLHDAIAVDRAAQAVLLSGADRWTGSLHGAVARIVDRTLDVKVNDPAFRAQNLTERHFVLFENQPHEMLTEWEERINLLSQNAAAA